jgi:hypothetical protein
MRASPIDGKPEAVEWAAEFVALNAATVTEVCTEMRTIRLGGTSDPGSRAKHDDLAVHEPPSHHCASRDITGKSSCEPSIRIRRRGIVDLTSR